MLCLLPFVDMGAAEIIVYPEIVIVARMIPVAATNAAFPFEKVRIAFGNDRPELRILNTQLLQRVCSLSHNCTTMS